MRSLGPHPVPAGSLPAASAVMSAPIIAKSPFSSSSISGQELPPWQLDEEVSLGPNFRMNITDVLSWLGFDSHARRR